MVDLLEKENPGCFDDSNKTFIDMYMKSGLYITEIVKRLFRSENRQRVCDNYEIEIKHYRLTAHTALVNSNTECI